MQKDSIFPHKLSRFSFIVKDYQKDLREVFMKGGKN